MAELKERLAGYYSITERVCRSSTADADADADANA